MVPYTMFFFENSLRFLLFADCLNMFCFLASSFKFCKIANIAKQEIFLKLQYAFSEKVEFVQISKQMNGSKQISLKVFWAKELERGV